MEVAAAEAAGRPPAGTLRVGRGAPERDADACISEHGGRVLVEPPPRWGLEGSGRRGSPTVFGAGAQHRGRTSRAAKSKDKKKARAVRAVVIRRGRPPVRQRGKTSAARGVSGGSAGVRGTVVDRGMVSVYGVRPRFTRAEAGLLFASNQKKTVLFNVCPTRRPQRTHTGRVLPSVSRDRRNERTTIFRGAAPRPRRRLRNPRVLARANPT
jgi:hypothetical protein